MNCINIYTGIYVKLMYFHKKQLGVDKLEKVLKKNHYA